METEFVPKFEFHVDWLHYTTSMLCEWELKELENIVDVRSSRFYNNVYQTEKAIISTFPKSNNNAPVSVFVNKPYRNELFDVGLPNDCNFTRIDFAIDCKTEREAKKYVSQTYFGVFDSIDGVTKYTGKRKGVVFERVYKKNDRGGVWRYEIELKPRAGREHRVIYSKLHKDVQAILNTVLGLRTNTGMNVDTRDFTAISKKRMLYIDIHLESPYCVPHKDFYLELDENEINYFNNQLNKMINERRKESWRKALDA